MPLSKKEVKALLKAKKSILADPGHAIMSHYEIFKPRGASGYPFEELDLKDASPGKCKCIAAMAAMTNKAIVATTLTRVGWWPDDLYDAWKKVRDLKTRRARQRARARLMAQRIDRYVAEMEARP